MVSEGGNASGRKGGYIHEPVLKQWGMKGGILGVAWADVSVKP